MTIETIEQARQFIGGSSALHTSKRSLEKLRDAAREDKATLQTARMNCTDAAKRMHYNGAIASKNSILNKIQQLLCQQK